MKAFDIKLFEAIAEKRARDESYWSGSALGPTRTPPYPGAKPRVGMGATLCHPSDRYPYTVVAVLSLRCVRVRGCASTEGFPERIGGKEHVLRMRANGVWRTPEGTPFALGYRDSYQAPEV